MSLFSYIEKLHLRSAHERKMLAFGAAAGITGVIAVGWGAAMLVGGTLAVESPQDPAVRETGAGESVGTLKQELSERFEGTQQEWARMQQMFNDPDAADESNAGYGISGGGAAATETEYEYLPPQGAGGGEMTGTAASDGPPIEESESIAPDAGIDY